MRHMVRMAPIAVFVAVIAVACGGGDSDSEVHQPHIAAGSQGGVGLTLLVPPAALPDGIASADIQIVPIPDSAAGQTSFELLPDGARFNEPVIVVVDVETTEGSVAAVLESSDGIELLSATGILHWAAQDRMATTFEITHFSELRVIRSGGAKLIVLEQPDKNRFDIGEAFTIRLAFSPELTPLGELRSLLHEWDENWITDPQWVTGNPSEFETASPSGPLSDINPNREEAIQAIYDAQERLATGAQSSPITPASVNVPSAGSIPVLPSQVHVEEPVFTCRSDGDFVIRFTTPVKTKRIVPLREGEPSDSEGPINYHHDWLQYTFGGTCGTPTDSTTSSSSAAAETDDDAGAMDTGVKVEKTDPQNDFEDPAPFDRHDDPPPSVDLSGATVTVEDDTTTITICFYGAAQDLVTAEGENTGGQQLGFDLLLSRPPDTQFVNILFNSIGDFSKVSDPPPGVSSQHRWISPDCIEFTVQGWAPVDGSVITVWTLAGAGGGPPPLYSRDMLEVTVPVP